MTCCSFDASTKIHLYVHPSDLRLIRFARPVRASPWTSPAASHASVTSCARAGWRRDRTLSRVRFLRTTPFMRPRAALDTTSVAYVLCRIEDDSSLTPVSRHGDFLTGIAAGRLRGRGRGPRFRVRPLRRRSLERVVHARGLLPRGQDRLPPLGHEDRAHQPERRGPLRPRRRRAHGVGPHTDRGNGAGTKRSAPFVIAVTGVRGQRANGGEVVGGSLEGVMRDGSTYASGKGNRLAGGFSGADSPHRGDHASPD